MIEENNELRRLPLWKTALEEMLRDGLHYGKTFSAEWFEKMLSRNRDQMEYSLDIHKIRRELERHGYYLSGRGQKGGFVIVQPSDNSKIMKHYQKAAKDSLERGVILGTNTNLDMLSNADRQKHEALVEKLATQSILLKRTKAISDVVNKSNSNMLK